MKTLKKSFINLISGRATEREMVNIFMVIFVPVIVFIILKAGK